MPGDEQKGASKDVNNTSKTLKLNKCENAINNAV